MTTETKPRRARQPAEKPADKKAAEAAKVAADTAKSEAEGDQPKRRRGRPKGSKNKATAAASGQASTNGAGTALTKAPQRARAAAIAGLDKAAQDQRRVLTAAWGVARARQEFDRATRALTEAIAAVDVNSLA